MIARIVAALAPLLLAPSRPEARLLPLDDASAATLTRAVTTVAALFGLIVATKNTFLATGSDLAHVEAIALVLGVAIVAVCIVAVWRVRKSIGDLIRRAGGNGPDRQLGRRPVALRRDRLPAVRVLRTGLGGDHRRAGPRRGHLSLVILVALPVVDFALSRTLVAAAAAPQHRPPVDPGGGSSRPTSRCCVA